MVARESLKLVALASMFAAGESVAFAAPAGAREVWLEARPWTCTHELVSLARDTELACDALGGKCRVASTAVAASQRAILVCESPEHWTLRMEGADGATLVSVELAGDREERLRKAAMWIARLEQDGPVEGPPRAAAPPVVPAHVEPKALATPHRATDDADADAVADDRRSPSGGIMADGSVGVSNGSFASQVAGAHAAIAVGVGPLHLGAGGGYERGFSPIGGFKDPTTSTGRVGIRVGWGAPFDDHVVGVALESGLAWGVREGSERYQFTNNFPPSDFSSAYGRAEIVVQIPLKPVRPYLALSGSHTFDQFGESVQTASAAMGLSWQAW